MSSDSDKLEHVHLARFAALTVPIAFGPKRAPQRQSPTRRKFPREAAPVPVHHSNSTPHAIERSPPPAFRSPGKHHRDIRVLQRSRDAGPAFWRTAFGRAHSRAEKNRFFPYAAVSRERMGRAGWRARLGGAPHLRDQTG